jgi:hypothetical protein
MKFDSLACPECRGGIRGIRFIEDEEVIEKIFKHVGHWVLQIRPPPNAKGPFTRPVIGYATFYRISELHFNCLEAFENGQKWRQANPFLGERHSKRKIDFKFYVVCDAEEIVIDR